MLYSIIECNYTACPSRVVLFVSLQLCYIQPCDKGRIKQKIILSLQTLAAGSPRWLLAGCMRRGFASRRHFVLCKCLGLEVTWLLFCAIAEECIWILYT